MLFHFLPSYFIVIWWNPKAETCPYFEINRLLKLQRLSGEVNILKFPRWTGPYHERTDITRQLPISNQEESLGMKSENQNFHLLLGCDALQSSIASVLYMSQQAGSEWIFGKKGRHKCKSNHLKKIPGCVEVQQQIKQLWSTSPNYLYLMKLPSKFQ